MFFLRKFLYGLCLYRTERRFRNKKNRAYEQRSVSDVYRSHIFSRWWGRTMPIILGGFKDRRPPSAWWMFEKRVRSYGTFENFISKSLCGFLFGVLLTYGLYFLFVFPLSFSFTGATMWCVIIGFLSALGLAFSEYFRSITLLSLPAFFSGKGRQALMTYALILAITGPGKNSLHNVRVLSDSIGCSQGRLRKSLRDVFHLVKNPYVPIKQTLSIVIAKFVEITRKLTVLTNSMKKLVLAMDSVHRMASRALDDMVMKCRLPQRRPNEACTRALNAASDDFKVMYGAELGQSKDLLEVICRDLPSSSAFYSLPSDNNNQISRRIQMKLSTFEQRLRHLLSFKIVKSYQAESEFRKTHEVKDTVNAIASDIRELTTSILYLFDSIAILFSLFYFYLFYSVITFRNQYLAHEWYENRYVTSNLLLLEMKRINQRKTTIFPLNRMESQKYIKINSLNLGTMDVFEMYNMIIKAAAHFIKLSLHMAADYGLWWLIMEFRRAANHVHMPEGMSNIVIESRNAGCVPGRIFNEITNAFQPNQFNFTTDMINCLPEPSAPDFKRNVTIVVIGVLTIIITFLEPYGRRLKICIMNFYYPTIARRRAVWLYNHILRTRNSFTRMARRRLRREFGRWDLRDPETSTFSRFRTNLGVRLPQQWKVTSVIMARKKTFNRCILCKTFGAPDDPLTHCVTSGCKGTYCLECFANLQNLCTICLKPIEYGDVSDISEERDSSEEESQWRVRETEILQPIGNTSDSEASTAEEEDFRTLLEELPVTTNKEDVENEEFLSTDHQCDIWEDKEKDWATMKDFDLPISICKQDGINNMRTRDSMINQEHYEHRKSAMMSPPSFNKRLEQEKDAIAEHGISITLAHRIKTGFSGLIFAKPVFSQTIVTEDGNESGVQYTLGTAKESVPETAARRSSTEVSSRRKLSSVPEAMWKFCRKKMPSGGSARSTYNRSRTSRSRFGSDNESPQKCLPGQTSNRSTNITEDNFRSLGRGYRRRLTDPIQVYYGLHSGSNSEYGRVENQSASEEDDSFSDDSSVLSDVKTIISWSSVRGQRAGGSTRTLKPSEGLMMKSPRGECTRSSCSSPVRRDYSWTSSRLNQIRSATVGANGKDIMNHNQKPLAKDFYTKNVGSGRPSFKNIKIIPTKSQRTHKMFNVSEDESD